MRVEFTLNGRHQAVNADPREPLLSVLREKLGLTGSKYGCGEGECGACSVLLNGRLVTSCMTLVGQVSGQSVVTIEAMSEDRVGKEVIKAFAEEGAVQCGFCTPGFVMATRDLLGRNPEPGRDQVREALSGNLCRCTGYTKIVDAAIAASQAIDHQVTPVEVAADDVASVNDVNFVRPDSLGAALDHLAQDDGLRVVCGSTDISVRYEHRLKELRLLDITALPELNFIREDNDAIVIGATTPYCRIIESLTVQQWAQILVRASREVGATQIQNLGTLGGNLVNASPSADAVPALMVLGASAVIRSSRGERTVTVEEIATGPGKTILAQDEIVTEVIIPKPINHSATHISFFEKLGPRQTQTISIASVSFHGRREGKGLSDVKIALGAVGPTIMPATRTADYLMAQPLSEETVLAASEIIRQECSPIDDIRGSAEYRRQLVAGLFVRGLWHQSEFEARG